MRKSIPKYRIAFIIMLSVCMFAFGSMFSFGASETDQSKGPSLTIYQMFTVIGVEPAGLDKSFDYVLTSDDGPLPAGAAEDGYVFALDGDDQTDLVFAGSEEASGEHVIKFEHAGVYLYHLALDSGSIPEDERYTIDTGEYNIKVFVANDGSGGLRIERVFALDSTVDSENPTEDQKLSSITYKHRYEGDNNPCFIDPPVTKEITGDAPAKDETFQFTITAKPDKSKLPEGETKMPMPEAANGAQSYTISIVGEGEKEFGEIWYNQPGKYVYEVTEKKGNAKGYTYDDSVYTVTADVTKDANGNLHAKTIYKKGLLEKDEIVFTNDYDETGGGDGGSGHTKTGDQMRLMLYVGIMIAAVAAIIIILLARRRRQNEE